MDRIRSSLRFPSLRWSLSTPCVSLLVLLVGPMAAAEGWLLLERWPDARDPAAIVEYYDEFFGDEIALAWRSDSELVLGVARGAAAVLTLHLFLPDDAGLGPGRHWDPGCGVTWGDESSGGDETTGLDPGGSRACAFGRLDIAALERDSEGEVRFLAAAFHYFGVAGLGELRGALRWGAPSAPEIGAVGAVIDWEVVADGRAALGLRRLGPAPVELEAEPSRVSTLESPGLTGGHLGLDWSRRSSVSPEQARRLAARGKLQPSGHGGLPTEPSLLAGPAPRTELRGREGLPPEEIADYLKRTVPAK